jgi:hypothetical protein
MEETSPKKWMEPAFIRIRSSFVLETHPYTLKSVISYFLFQDIYL